jgi:hypothetical protein
VPSPPPVATASAVVEGAVRKPLSPLRSGATQGRTATFSDGRGGKEGEGGREGTAEGETTLDGEEEEAAAAAEEEAEEAEEEAEEEELSRHAGRHLLLQRAVHAWRRSLPTQRRLPARLVPCGNALGRWRAHCLHSHAAATQPSPADEAVELLQVWGAAGTSSTLSQP